MTSLRVIAAALPLAFLASCGHYDPVSWHRYGARDQAMGDPVAIGALSGGETEVTVKGTITEVCPVKGCWMRVTDGDDEVFVRFKDYGFFVPRNAAGHRAVIHGVAEAKVVSVEELRHYAQDAGKTAEEIAAITAPGTQITFMAGSVEIAGGGLDRPYVEEP